MYARLTTIEGLPDRMDDATRHVQEQTLPQLQEMDGFKGFVALGDRQSGRLVGVAFWDSEGALRATEQAVSGVQRGGARRRRIGSERGAVRGRRLRGALDGAGGRGHRHGGRCRGQPLGGRGEAELERAGNPSPRGEQ